MRRAATVLVLAIVASTCANDDALEAAASDDAIEAVACPAVTSVAPGVDQWTTDDGCAVDPERIRSHPGPAECGWELVDYLLRDGRTYHWDPVNFLAYVDGRARNRIVRTSELPAGAVDTGLRRGEEQLWEQPDDAEYVYVVSDGQADRYLHDAEGAISCD